MPATIIRHPRAFLLGVLATTAGLAALRLARIPVVSTVALGLLGVAWLGLALGTIVALNARRPETFQIRDGAYTTPPPAEAILTAGAFTAMTVALACEDVDAVQLPVVVLLALLAPLQWAGVLGTRYGLFLRPDGLLERGPLGSLFVPWEAGPTAEPTTSGVRLRFTHPDLVVRRGFRPGAAIRTGADRGFTAWAVNLYTAHPNFRPSIGTTDGLLRLTPPTA